MAYGRLNWTSERFWSVDISEFVKALRGFNELEEIRVKRSYEVARYTAQKMMLPYIKNAAKDFWKLPWDEVETRESFLKRHESFNEAWDRL